jgi:hypothetical protein
MVEVVNPEEIGIYSFKYFLMEETHVLSGKAGITDESVAMT